MFRNMTFTNSRTRRLVLTVAAGRAVSLLGDEVALLALALRARGLYGHFGVALVLGAGALPLLLLAAPAGRLVDKVRAKPLLVATLLAQGLICVGLAVAPSVALVPLVALLACGQAVVSPAWQALIVGAVSEDERPSAFGALQSASALAALAGPFVGGLLFAYAGFAAALVLDAASFVILAGVAWVLRADRVPTASPAGEKQHGGFSLIARQPKLRAAMAAAATLVLTVGMVNVAEVYFVTGTLHAGPVGYGILGLCFGAGALVAGLRARWITSRLGGAERTFAIACATLCALLGAFGAAPNLAVAALVAVAVGVGNATLNVSVQLLFAAHAPAEARGRVFAALQGIVGGCSIVALAVGGVLLSVMGPRSVILLGAAVSVLAVSLAVRPLLRGGPSADRTASPAIA
jgi:MFS family permease